MVMSYALLLISIGYASPSDSRLDHRYALVMLEHRYACNIPVILVLNVYDGTYAAALLQGRITLWSSHIGRL